MSQHCYFARKFRPSTFFMTLDFLPSLSTFYPHPRLFTLTLDIHWTLDTRQKPKLIKHLCMYWYNKFSITTFWFSDCLDSTGYNRSAQINFPNFLCSDSEQNLYFVLANFFYVKCTYSKASMLA